jgi:Spy/CpxP family protein refolding chaperone
MKTHTLGWALMMALALPAIAPAQAGGAPRAQMLRGRVETAFLDQVSRQLALTPEQRVGVEKVLTDWGSRRRELETEERLLTIALGGQLRPGVAANADSVTRLVDRLLANRVAHAESFQGELRELTPVLSPAQRGQFVMMRDQIFRRIRELQEGRATPGSPLQGMRNRP